MTGPDLDEVHPGDVLHGELTGHPRILGQPGLRVGVRVGAWSPINSKVRRGVERACLRPRRHGWPLKTGLMHL